MSPAALTIRRLRVEALVPSDYPECDRLRRRIADTMRRAFPEALRQTLSQWVGERVLLIRRLRIDRSLDLALSDEALAEGLAGAIAEEIARLGNTPDENVVLFPDRAAHLAAFLLALAGDCARDRWWFRAFDGVAALPKPAAIRTVLLAEPAEGAQALDRLPPDKRLQVILALGEAGAVRVGQGFAAAAAGAPSLDAAVAALAAAGRDDGAGFGLPPCGAALDLYLSVATARSALAGRTLFAAATALAQLRAGLGELGAQRATGLLRALRRGAPPLPMPAAAGLRHALALLLPLPAAERRAAVAFALAARPPTPGAAAAEGRAAVAFTRFGGLFLLLPSLGELPIAAETAAWPQPPAGRAEDLLSLLVLAACAGRSGAAAVLSDPLWRDLLRLPPALDAAAVAGWLTTLPRRARAGLARSATAGAVSRRDARHLALPPAWCPSRRTRRRLAGIGHAVLRGFARRLPGFAASSAGFLWRNFLQVGARVEIEGDAIRVFLARPALDVMLTITGLGRASFTLPDGRGVSIEPVE